MSPTLPHGLLQAGRGPRWRADDGVTRPAPWRSGAPATDGRPGRPAWSDPPPVPRSRPPLDTGNPASTRPLWPAPGRPGHAHSVTAHQPAADIEHVGMTAPTDPLTTGPRPSTFARHTGSDIAAGWGFYVLPVTVVVETGKSAATADQLLAMGARRCEPRRRAATIRGFLAPSTVARMSSDGGRGR